MVLAEMDGLECDWGNLLKMRFTPQENTMKAQKHCAYNHTRECFLGLDLTVTDPAQARSERSQFASLRSGSGSWVVPFQGNLDFEVPAALDLIFLDSDWRVVQAVESYSKGGIDLAGLRVASLLVLPVHSIYPSQTQVGDQLVVCEAGEMKQRLDELSSGFDRISITSAAVLRQEPLWSAGSGVLQFENPIALGNGTLELRHEMGLVKPDSTQYRGPRNWLERWWSPDPRQAPRHSGTGLAAYYWNGAAPKAHGIRDISKSGIYVVTEDRWYPGTLVLMTLQRTDNGEKVNEPAIAVQTRAVRWGQDGVGLQFVLSGNGEISGSGGQAWQLATTKEIAKFVKKLKDEQ